MRYSSLVTARQIIEEYRKLPPQEQEEVRAELEKRQSPGEIPRADYKKAMAVADRIFTDHAELFQKLAK
jgi:hypothetical protein